jgi:hypothetical protein
MKFSVAGFGLYFETYELMNGFRFFSFLVNPVPSKDRANKFGFFKSLYDLPLRILSPLDRLLLHF